MKVADAILSRKSVRAFTDEPVSNETIRKILDIARRAPSGGNLQPWLVYVLNGAVRDRFVQYIDERVVEHPMGETPDYNVYPPGLKQPYRSRRSRIGRMLYELIGVPRDDRAGKMAHFARNYRFFDAPAAMLFTIDRDMEPGQWVDLGLFMQNVMLLARENGLDTCPQESWAVWSPAIREFCGVPDNEIVFCGLAIGHADQDATVNQLVSEREEIDSFTRFVQ